MVVQELLRLEKEADTRVVGGQLPNVFAVSVLLYSDSN